ncbi:MAG TPA: LLM class F420-dependent oxidoreductase [Acidimicrobiales bacterium]|nr:LLM class F420-dependent oxidoreductase [Acidimicrobiales bacterium]
MKFGIAFANTGPFASAPALDTFAKAAEGAGIESVWTVEHVIFPSAYESEYPYDKSGKMAMDVSTPLPDPLLWLAFVAAATEKLRLATGILILPQRNPLVLAKTLATLDDLSGGRVELGIGVGWLEEEFDALGVPFRERGRRTDDAVEILRKAWAGDEVSHHSDFFDFDEVSVNPKPVNGAIPIHVGGHSVAAAKRAGRLGDGFFPAKGDLAEMVDIVRQSAADANRDPEAIEITFGDAGLFGDDPVGAVQEAEAKGIDRVIIPAFLHWADPAESLGAFGENVISKVNG